MDKDIPTFVMISSEDMVDQLKELDRHGSDEIMCAVLLPPPGLLQYICRYSQIRHDTGTRFKTKIYREINSIRLVLHKFTGKSEILIKMLVKTIGNDYRPMRVRQI